MAEDVRVSLPTNPPVWTPRLARIMLRILTEAKAKQDAEEVAAVPSRQDMEHVLSGDPDNWTHTLSGSVW